MSSLRPCQYCGKLFSRSFNLRRHLQNNSCKMKDNDGMEEMDSDAESIKIEMSSESSDASDSETSDESSGDSGTESDDSELSWYWQTLLDEATERYKKEKNIIVENLMSDGETETNAILLANEKLLFVLRKELRKILMERLEWMHAIKKDCYFKKIMKTRRELLDSGADYDWYEATKLAIHQRKFLLDELIPSNEKEEESDAESEAMQ